MQAQQKTPTDGVGRGFKLMSGAGGPDANKYTKTKRNSQVYSRMSPREQSALKSSIVAAANSGYLSDLAASGLIWAWRLRHA